MNFGSALIYIGMDTVTYNRYIMSVFANISILSNGIEDEKLIKIVTHLEIPVVS